MHITLEGNMRISIPLAVVVVLVGLSTGSVAGTNTLQQQAAKRADSQSTKISPIRQQVRKLLTSSPAYRPL